MTPKLPPDQPVWNLSEHTRSVSRSIRRPSAPVVESLQAFHSQSSHPVRRSAVQRSDEPDAAGVMFDAWIDMRCRHFKARVGNIAV